MHILIIRVSAIGDVIHTLPALVLLKQQFPHAQIHWVVQKKAANLLAGQQFIDKVWILPDKFLHPKNWLQTLAVIKNLRKQQWDAIIDFQSLIKTAILVLPLRGKKFGFSAPHARERASTWFTDYHDSPIYVNIVQKNLSLASAVAYHLGNTTSSPSTIELQKQFTFNIPKAQQNLVDYWLEDNRAHNPVLLCPNTTWESKHWPEDNWIKFIKLLLYANTCTCTPILVGTTYGKAAANIAELCKQQKIRILICPPWDLLTMSHIIKQAKLVIAPDTGILHLADFIKTPAIGIFGPTSKERSGPFWEIENQKHTIQAPKNCMLLLTPQQLINKVLNYRGKFMIFLTLFFLCCTYGSLNCSNQIVIETPAPTILTIQEAVEIAILNKPNLQAYKYAIEAAKTKGMQALSEYLPQVNLSTKLGQTIGNQSIQTTMGIDATQLVYSFAGPIEKYKKEKKERQIKELTYDQAKKEIKLEVEKAFLDCWKLQQHNKDILSLHRSNQSTYEAAQHTNKLQLSDKSVWLQSNVDYAKNMATIDNYYKELALAQKKLEFFMGQPIDLSLTNLDAPQKNTQVLTLALEWQEPKEINLLPLTTYYKYAMKNKDALKVADKKIGIAKDEIYIQAHSNLPTVKLHAYTGYQSVESTLVAEELQSLGKPMPRNRYTVEAQISWPIFNGLLNDYKEKEAHALMVKEMLEKDQVMQEIKWSVDQAHTMLEQAITNLKAQKAQLIFDKNELKLKQQQFNLGTISKVDFNTALTTWEKSNYAWLEKQIETTKQERALAYACGYPKELFN